MSPIVIGTRCKLLLQDTSQAPDYDRIGSTRFFYCTAHTYLLEPRHPHTDQNETQNACVASSLRIRYLWVLVSTNIGKML